MSPGPALTFAEKLGIAGFILACGGLAWNAATWKVEHRIKPRVKLFQAKHRPLVAVECVNASHRWPIQVRQVWIQWGKDSAKDGAELHTSLWNKHGPIGPGEIFQATVPMDLLREKGLPELPVEAWGVVRIGTRSKPYPSRRVFLH